LSGLSKLDRRNKADAFVHHFLHFNIWAPSHFNSICNFSKLQYYKLKTNCLWANNSTYLRQIDVTSVQIYVPFLILINVYSVLPS
jgi:hypothetical protein